MGQAGEERGASPQATDALPSDGSPPMLAAGLGRGRVGTKAQRRRLTPPLHEEEASQDPGTSRDEKRDGGEGSEPAPRAIADPSS